MQGAQGSNYLENSYFSSYYKVAFALSLLLHTILAFAGYYELKTNPPKSFIKKNISSQKKLKVVYFDLDPVKKVYVPESNSKKLKEPPKTNQLSKYNSSVLKEQIKRGDDQTGAGSNTKQIPLSQPKEIPPPPKAEQKSSEKKVIKKELKKKESIKKQPARKKPVKRTPIKKPSPKKTYRFKLDIDDLVIEDLKQENLNQAKANISENSNLNEITERTKKLNQARPFRSSFSKQGSSAYLPKIPDGNITLLNSKADRHAVFVSRVAVQVFGKLKNLSWSQLTSNQIGRIREYATVKATMNEAGELIDTELLESSGSREFDQSLLQAVKEGTWDQNPPSSAKAELGNCKDKICFIFKAKIWSQKFANSQINRRWMVMGTGLE